MRGPGLAQRRTFAALRAALGRIRSEIASMLQDDPIASHTPDRSPPFDHTTWLARSTAHESRGRPPDFGDTVPTYAHPDDLLVGKASSVHHQHRQGQLL